MMSGSTSPSVPRDDRGNLGITRLGRPVVADSEAIVVQVRRPKVTRRPRVAALTTVYSYLSHAYHIVGRFIDGFPLHDGRGLHVPPFEIASLFIEQTPAPSDLGKAKAKRHGIRICPTIADALTLGTGKLAVDAVLLIAEHGDYPYNAKLQKFYPRGRFFRDVLDVFQASGRSVPVFIDKHLSFDRAEASEMVEQARHLNVPLMAGSSLPVTWRLPPLEIPLGRPFKEAIVASRGDLEIFGFHALETLQCMVERRDRHGKAQGVVAVTCLEGDAVWAAGDQGVWSWPLLHHALARSHTVNPGDIRQNTRDYVPPPAPGRDALTKLRHPVAFVVEYADGLRATVLILNGHVDDTTFAARLNAATGGDTIVSTLTYLPAPPGASFFNPLVLRIEDFFRTGRCSLSRGADTAHGRDSRCGSRKPNQGPRADRHTRPGRHRLSCAGRFRVYPDAAHEPGAESAVKPVHTEFCSGTFQ